MPVSTMNDRFSAQLAALDSGEHEAAAGCFHPDGVLLVPSRPPLVGRTQIRASYDEFVLRYPRRRSEQLSELGEGTRYMSLVRVRLTALDGEDVELLTSAVVTFDGELIRQCRLIFDTAVLAAREPQRSSTQRISPRRDDREEAL